MNRTLAQAGQGARRGGRQPAADRASPSPAGAVGRLGSGQPHRAGGGGAYPGPALAAGARPDRARAGKPVAGPGRAGALFWFGRGGWLKGLALLAALGALLGLSTYALWQGDYLRVANIVMVMLLAYGARLAWDFIRHFRQRQMLRTMFAGHVSPQVMRALLGGDLQIEENGRSQEVTLLAVGIRGFAARAAKATAASDDRIAQPLSCRGRPGHPEQRRRGGQIRRRWPDGDLRPAAAAGRAAAQRAGGGAGPAACASSA
jgi:hypothetical protein